MDKRGDFVAVASSDGIVVNNHFGRAEKFLIYEISDDDMKYIEERKVTPVCNGGNHEDGKLEENMRRISDCKYLLVSRIGQGAELVARNLGIEPYEIPGEIKESIEQLIKFKQINELFR